MSEMKRIFSGEYSVDMWKMINTAKTVKDLRGALYFVCCRLQELESRMAKDKVFPKCRKAYTPVGEDEGMVMVKADSEGNTVIYPIEEK